MAGLAGRCWAAMSGRLSRVGLVAILGEERLLERWLAADEVDELVAGGLADHRRDRAGYAHLQRLALGGDLADAGDRGEGAGRDVTREDELDLVVGEVAEGL